MELVNQAVSYLNAHPEDLVALSGLVSVAVQYGINHIKGFGKLTNAVMGLVAIPGVVTAGAALSTNLHATSFPVVVLVGQLLYHVYEGLKRRVVAKATVATPAAPSFLDEPAPVPQETVSEY